jgi:hypothetical protein
MSKITLDNDLRAKLNGLNSPLEICDEAGQTVGHFLPSALYKKFAYAALATECPYSAQELERMHQETGGRPLAELWNELRSEWPSP